MSIKVTVPNNSSDSLIFGSANTTNASQVTGIDSGSSNGQLAFYTTASGVSTERMRIDSSGNVGIGTSSPVNNGAGTTALTINGTTDSRTEYWVNGSALGKIYVNTDFNLWMTGSGAMRFQTSGTERMRIDSSGNLLVGTTSTQFCTIWTGAGSVIRNPSTTANTKILEVAGGTDTSVPTFAVFYNANNGNMNTSNSTVKIGQMAATGRSINATGSINANGADYAEYMTKAGDFTVAKGDVVGINADGKLTNVFSDAISFAVKSTAPSYVGGDTWGSGFDNDPEGLEAARQLVDRIAFCGQVPVNVLGATAGQFIIPVNDNGAIKGEAVSNPTFEQYQIAVGKVIAIEDDGRARIIVKVA